MKQKQGEDKIARIVAYGAIGLVLTMAILEFGRVFFLAAVTGINYPVNDSIIQVLTAFGSSLIGGAVGYIAGTNAANNSNKK
jgi:hypothetical protein